LAIYKRAEDLNSDNQEQIQQVARVGLETGTVRLLVRHGDHSATLPLRYQICIVKCLYSYRDDFPKNLFQITAEGCKKSTSG